MDAAARPLSSTNIWYQTIRNHHYALEELDEQHLCKIPYVVLTYLCQPFQNIWPEIRSCQKLTEKKS